MRFTNKTRLLLILHWCGANLLMVLGNDFPTIEDIINEIKVYFLKSRYFSTLFFAKFRQNCSIKAFKSSGSISGKLKKLTDSITSNLKNLVVLLCLYQKSSGSM